MSKIFFFFAFLLYFSAGSIAAREIGTWCIAKIDAPDDKMQGFLDYVCGEYDCSPINPGGQCYEPNTLKVHTNYALDLLYKSTGNCDLEIGQIVLTDPSSSTCIYP